MTVRRLKHLPTLPSLLARPHLPLIHRDLSWLQFNERVLANARGSSHNPLLERAKFLGITSTNLDEFFLIRFASLNRQRKSLRQEEIRATLLENIAEFVAKSAEALDALLPELEVHGIHVIRRLQERAPLREMGKGAFENHLFPHLQAPRPFQYARLAELTNLQIAVWFPSGQWFTVPRGIPPLVKVEQGGEHFFFFIDDLLLNFLGPAFDVKGEPVAVRLTRDSDFTADLQEYDDPVSIPDVVRSGVRSREKGVPVRLQYRGNVTADFLNRAMRALKLDSVQLFPATGSLCLHGLWSLTKELPASLAERPELGYKPLQSRRPKALRGDGTVFQTLREQDILLHHPYDSFDAFADWLGNAGKDEDVIQIEQTIYRTDAGSKIVEVLKEAAKRKRIRVMIELRARFDELNNLSLADELRKAGVEVGFGFGNLKLHAKITLITRREEGGVRHYTHLSTGNYNASTARAYTDLAILTADPQIGEDARYFFDSLWAGKVPSRFKTLVTAPTALHKRLLDHIKGEIAAARRGEKARIVAKVNAFVDETVIQSLYEASQAGVQVDLIVRGACALVPGIAGLSKNIRVISVVDRFLEHSRLYYFESQKALYFSSADWMPRNFYSRLEIAFPVKDARIFAFIRDELLPAYLGDNVRAMELTQQGTWKRRVKAFRATPLRAQFHFEALSLGDYKGTTLG